MRNVLVFLLMIAASLQGITFSLNKESLVNRETVYLSDLIKPVSDENVAVICSEIIICGFSYAERFKNITSEEIRKKIENRFSERVQINGGVTVLRWAEEIISETELRQAVEKFAQQSLGEKIKPEIQNYPEIKIPSGKSYTLDFAFPDKLEKRGNILLKTSVSIAGEKKIYTIPVKLTSMQEVWRLSSSKKRNELIMENDIFSSLEETTYLTDVICNKQDIIGKLTKQYLPTGTIITAANIKDEPLIRRGEIIDVSVIGDNITIRTQAIAREDGYKNEKIVCRNQDSNEDFTVLVTDRNHAMIKLEEK